MRNKLRNTDMEMDIRINLIVLRQTLNEISDTSTLHQSSSPVMTALVLIAR